MDDRKPNHRGEVVVEINGGCYGYGGDMSLVAEGSCGMTRSGGRTGSRLEWVRLYSGDRVVVISLLGYCCIKKERKDD